MATRRRKRGPLGGITSEHRQGYEDYAGKLEDLMRRAKKATTCYDMFVLGAQAGAASAVAIHEIDYAFRDDAFGRKAAEQRVDKAVVKLVKFDEKFRQTCLVKGR